MDLNILQIAEVGMPNDNSALPHPGPHPSPSSRLPSSPSSTNTHDSPFSPTILRPELAQNSLDDFDFPSHTSDNSSLPPAPSPAHTPAASSGSTCYINPTALHNYNPKAQDGSSSFYLAHPHSHHRKGSVGICERDNSSLPSSPERHRRLVSRLGSRAAHSNPTLDHVDASSGAGSPSSAVTSFFRRTVQRVRRPSGESDKRSDLTRNGGQEGENAEKQSIMNNLEERLEAAKRLHGEAVDLQMFYESGTVAAMQDLRATGIPRPLPQDNTIFNEVDFILAEIGRAYEELNKFWKEEIRYLAEALKKGRTDPRDFECWNNTYSSLKQTIEFWKKRPPSDNTQTLRSNNTLSSTGVDLGAISSSLSPTVGSLEDALDRMSSSASLRYSQLGWSCFQRVYVAFAGNSDLCLSFLQHCADYGEKVLAWRPASIGSPTSSRVGVSHDLRERTTGLWSEVTCASAKSFETLEVGGVGTSLRGRSHHGLSAGTPPTHHVSPDPTVRCFTVSHGMDEEPPRPDIMITPPAGVSGEPIEDRQRILGRNILPQRPIQSLLHLMWLALKDKVLVLLSIYAIVSLSLSFLKGFSTNRTPGIPQ